MRQVSGLVWNLFFGSVWLIFLLGYFHFYVAAILVISMKTDAVKSWRSA